MKSGKLLRIHNNSPGFTLVELMIVVAIIGILAAIALPQFAAYRIRSFNASALSDVRNMHTAEQTFYAAWYRYGVTQSNAGVFAAVAPGGAAGAAIVGGDGNGDGIATVDTGNNPRGFTLFVNNGVTIIANTDAAATAAVAPTAFAAAGKHSQGNITFGIDSDSSNIYQHSTLIPVGTALTIADFVVPININIDDFAGIAAWIIK